MDINNNKKYLIDDLIKLYKTVSINNVDQINMDEIKKEFNLPKKFVCFQTDEDKKNRTVRVKAIYH